MAQLGLLVFPEVVCPHRPFQPQQPVRVIKSAPWAIKSEIWAIKSEPKTCRRDVRWGQRTPVQPLQPLKMTSRRPKWRPLFTLGQKVCLEQKGEKTVHQVECPKYSIVQKNTSKALHSTKVAEYLTAHWSVLNNRFQKNALWMSESHSNSFFSVQRSVWAPLNWKWSLNQKSVMISL